MTKFVKKLNAFTLIELLIVVSVIAILSLVTLRMLNISSQKNLATDAVKRSTLEKLAQGIEAYGAAEGSYPADATADLIPDGTSTYIKSWSTIYKYLVDTTGFSIYVVMSFDATKYLKYNSSTGTIQECTNITSVTSCL